MNLIQRPDYYTPAINTQGEIIERQRQLDFVNEQMIWSKTHIVAIVAIVALTYMLDSNNKRDVELAKVKQEQKEEKVIFDFHKFIGVRK